MHLRPDEVYRTGVIQPFWTRVLSPVDIARHTIDPFIASVRGPGPAVAPTPDPQVIAQAASRVAEHFRQGASATIRVGDAQVRVHPNQAPGGGIIGAIVHAAQAIASGQPVTIKHGPQQSFMPAPFHQPQEPNNMHGNFYGPPTTPSGMPVQATVSPAAGGPTQVTVRATPFAQPRHHQNHQNHQNHRPFVGPYVQIPNVPRVPNVPSPADRGFMYYHQVMDNGSPYRQVERQSIAPYGPSNEHRHQTMVSPQAYFNRPQHQAPFFGPYVQIPNVPGVPNAPGPMNRGFSHYHQVMQNDSPYRAVERQSIAPFNRTRFW